MTMSQVLPTVLDGGNAHKRTLFLIGNRQDPSRPAQGSLHFPNTRLQTRRTHHR